MEDIDSKVFDLFENFIRDLSTTFPEIKGCLYRNYEKEILHENNLKIKDSEKIQTFLKQINDNKSLIENKDEKLIQDDICFLEEISFNRLWDKNISNNTKETIWKYLQTFVIININLNSSEQLKNAIESIEKSEKIKKNTANDLKTLKKLTQEVKKETIDTSDENELENMIGGMMDSDIGNIAKEVASSINIEEMFGDVSENTNPMELFSNIMQPDKMQDIFKNIGSVMEKKMEKGELNKEDLKNQADQLFGSLSNNQMFNSVMGQMNQSVNQSPLNNQEDKKELTKEEKQKILREKIKKKQENRSKN